MALRVAVLSGGFSEEQHASRRSAESVAKALCELGHIPLTVEYNRDFATEITNLSPDAVFHTVQGKFHGDGAVQAVLELIGVPYTGSRPHAAALINHKTICKKIWRSSGIVTPDFFEYSRSEYANDSYTDFKRKADIAGFTLPVVVKPPTQGGRFGMVFVNDCESFAELRSSFRYDDVLLAERYVEGRFITQGLIEINGVMTAMPPVEIVDHTNERFKRFVGGTTACDPRLEPEMLAEIKRTGLAAAALLDASGYARLDYHISGGKLYLLEINAVPGLTPGYGDMIKCSEAAGYDYPTFIGMILATAKTARLKGTIS